MCRADDDNSSARWKAEKPRPQGLLGKLFAPKESAEEAPAKPAKPATGRESSSRPMTYNRPPIPRTSSKGDVVGQLAKERENYLRRLQVCQRIRDIAQETGNTALEKEADQLEERASTIYQQRAARLLSTDVEMTTSSKVAEEKLLTEPALPKLPRNDTAQIHTIKGSGTSATTAEKE
jgi:hypothetical protein